MAAHVATLVPSVPSVDFEAYLQDRSLERRDAIVIKYAPLVKRLAAHFARDFSQREDLEQVGYVGLIKAVERFDPRHGVPFGAYARTIVSGEISHYLRDLAPLLRPPRWYRTLKRRMQDASDRLVGRLSRAPSDDEIAAEMNIRVEGVREIRKLEHSHNLLSLSPKPDQPDTQVNVEAIRSQRHVTFQLPIEDRIVLDGALERLAEFERSVVHLFFYMDLTQTEIAHQLGSTQRQISRTLAKTIQKLKKDIN